MSEHLTDSGDNNPEPQRIELSDDPKDQLRQSLETIAPLTEYEGNQPGVDMIRMALAGEKVSKPPRHVFYVGDDGKHTITINAAAGRWHVSEVIPPERRLRSSKRKDFWVLRTGNIVEVGPSDLENVAGELLPTDSQAVASGILELLRDASPTPPEERRRLGSIADKLRRLTS